MNFYPSAARIAASVLSDTVRPKPPRRSGSGSPTPLCLRTEKEDLRTEVDAPYFGRLQTLSTL